MQKDHEPVVEAGVEDKPPKAFLNVKLLITEGIFLFGALLMIVGMFDIDPLNLPVSNMFNSTNILLEVGIIIMMFTGTFLFKSVLGKIKDLQWGKPMAIIGIVLLIASPVMFTFFVLMWLFIVSVMMGFLGLQAYTVVSFVFFFLKVLAVMGSLVGVLLCAMAKRRSEYVKQVLESPPEEEAEKEPEPKKRASFEPKEASA